MTMGWRDRKLHAAPATSLHRCDNVAAAELAAMSIVPVTKTLVIDLLDAAYRVSATQTIKDVIAEKVEGMAWGPDLPDGRHLLFVVTDNDLFRGLPTQIYAFAIDGAAAHI